MPILNIITSQAGLTGVLPSVAYIQTSDPISTVVTAGYLTKSVQSGLVSFSMPCLATVSTIESAGAAPVVGTYNVSYANGAWSLTDTAGGGSVTLPTIANHIAVYTNTSGGLSEDATTAINGGNIQAGLSGTAGAIYSYPSTASKGKFIYAAVANTGNTDVTISNAAHGQATVYSLGDIGASTGGVVVATSAIRMKSVAGAAAAGGAAAQSFTDTFCTSASNVVGNWNTQANAASVLKIVPGNGSFVVTSSADAGVGTFNYIITK